MEVEIWATAWVGPATATIADADANAYAGVGGGVTLGANMAALVHRSAQFDPENDCPIRGESNRPDRLLE